jgi:hypothetical protein
MESTNKTILGRNKSKTDFNVANSSHVTKVKIESAKA